jgi:upstream activation factor subunit UAF30
MPSNKKKHDQTAPLAETPAPVESVKKPPTVKPSPVEKKASKTAPVKLAKTEPVEMVQPVDVTKVVPEVENLVVVSDADTSISSGFSDFIAKFQSLVGTFNSLKAELRSLEKMTVKQLKVAEKLNNRKKRKGNRAPSGFVKPSLISDELAKFLDKPSGTEMARTDVTREINKYIRANNLQDKSNGRKINPDKQLTQLLKIGESVDLTYFNLQKYMGPHFPKTVKVEVAKVEPVASA